MIRQAHVPARGGFTIVELLIAASIIAMLGVVLAGALHGGLRIWEVLHRQNDAVTAAALGAEIWARDVRNAVDVPAVDTHGTGHDMVLGILMQDQTSAGRLRPGAVSYTFDNARHVLVRRTWLSTEQTPVEGAGEVLLAGIAEAGFEYRVRGVNGEISGWRSDFMTRDGSLGAVRFNVRFDDAAALPFNRTVWRPGIVPLANQR